MPYRLLISQPLTRNLAKRGQHSGLCTHGIGCPKSDKAGPAPSLTKQKGPYEIGAKGVVKRDFWSITRRQNNHSADFVKERNA